MIAASFILFAAPGVQEIFSVLVAIVFFVVWLVNQIADAKKQQREKEAAQAELPPEPADAEARPAPAAPQDPLRAQVDEFLRRAGKKPGGKPSGQPAQRKPPAREEIVVLLDDSVADSPRRSPAQPTKVPPKPTPAAQEKRPAAPQGGRRTGTRHRGKSVAEHVAEHAGASSGQFRQEVADLGQRVKQADEQFDRQLQQKFGHELGTLATRTASAEPVPQVPVVSPAKQIAELMASPDGVRQAIVLNEILRRPTDRW